MVNKSKNIEVIEIIKPKIINGFDLTFSFLFGVLFDENKLLSFFLLKRLWKGLTTIKYISKLVDLVF